MRKVGLLLGLLVVVLAALLLVGCQRSANPPVYPVEVEVDLASGWEEVTPPVRFDVRIFRRGSDLPVAVEYAIWREGPPPAVVTIHLWLERGSYDGSVTAQKPDPADPERGSLATFMWHRLPEFTVPVDSLQLMLESTSR